MSRPATALHDYNKYWAECFGIASELPMSPARSEWFSRRHHRAAELAKHLHDAVRQVMTLGSPFNDPEGNASNLSDLYKMFNQDHQTKSEQFKGEDWELQAAPPVPTTSIYSKFDGICHWRACMQRGGHDQVENIEVLGSHTGMGVNAQTMFIVADRLSQRRHEWKPFHVGRYFGLPASAA
jgi:hypothetical protein